MIDLPNIPERAKIPQKDYLEELERIRQDNRAIMVDGPAGDKMKAILNRLLLLLSEVL
jgi:hypothetical protein